MDAILLSGLFCVNNNVLVTSVQGTSDNKKYLINKLDRSKGIVAKSWIEVFIGVPSSGNDYVFDELTPKILINVSDNSDSPKYITRVFDRLEINKEALIFALELAHEK